MKSENNNNSISLLKIWNNKFIVLVITAVIVIFGTIFFYLSNLNKTIVKHRFNYSFITIDETYPDGTNFDYATLLNYETVKEITLTNSNFNNIDITSLLNDTKTGIVKNNNEDEYILNIPLKYFNNDLELATTFIDSFHNFVIDDAKTKNKNITMYNYFSDINYQNNYTYSELIELIGKQNKIINDIYQDYINEYQVVILEDGTSLETLYLNFNDFLIHDFNIELIASSINDNFYYNNIRKTIENSKLEYSSIKNKIDFNNSIIEELTQFIKDSTVNVGNDLLKKLSELTKSNILLEENSKYIKYFSNDKIFIESNESIIFKERFFKLLNNYTSYIY